MKKVVCYFIKSLLSGIMIGIAGTIFLSVPNKIVGACLFTIGLFTIVVKGLNLFTGKIGYLFDNKISYVIELIMTVIGNFVGTYLVAFLLRFTRIYSSIYDRAKGLCLTKLNDNILSIFILSIFCGILMYLAVDSYRKSTDLVNKYVLVFMGVIVFILCGFEHSIANMYYFAVYNNYTLKVFAYILVMIAGNSVGSFVFPLCNKLLNKMSS